MKITIIRLGCVGLPLCLQAALTDALPLTKLVYQDFHAGTVRHSLADISKAQRRLGYAPTHQKGAGLEVALDWYYVHAT